MMQESLAEEMIARFDLNKVRLECLLSILPSTSEYYLYQECAFF